MLEGVSKHILNMANNFDLCLLYKAGCISIKTNHCENQINLTAWKGNELVYKLL